MSDEVEYATQQALSNEGAQSVALTDSKPMRDLLHANGEDNAETFEWHITKLPEDQIVPAATVKRVAMALYAEVYVTRAREPTWDGRTDPRTRCGWQRRVCETGAHAPALDLVAHGQGVYRQEDYSRSRIDRAPDAARAGDVVKYGGKTAASVRVLSRPFCEGSQARRGRSRGACGHGLAWRSC